MTEQVKVEEAKQASTQQPSKPPRRSVWFTIGSIATMTVGAAAAGAYYYLNKKE